LLALWGAWGGVYDSPEDDVCNKRKKVVISVFLRKGIIKCAIDHAYAACDGFCRFASSRPGSTYKA
jgi:hypothetical protein